MDEEKNERSRNSFCPKDNYFIKSPYKKFLNLSTDSENCVKYASIHKAICS